MGVEAQDRFKLTSGAVAWLQRHPDRIHELTAFRDAARQLDALPLRLLPRDSRIISEATDLSGQHGLLINDATIVALMRRHAVVHLATNDDDFDHVPGLTVRKPR
jgi:predicted nucleic acid-binding protein